LRLWIEMGTRPQVALNLWLAKIMARVSLACVWLWEGLIPKLILVRASEVDLVARSGLYLYDARFTLHALGLAEVLFGLWLLTGRAERFTAGLAAAGAVILGALVALLEPSSLWDPLGGISKNLGLVGCSAAVWLLAPLAPGARQEAKG